MFARGLKANIAINIAILLLLAMILIDIVTTMTAKRDLVRAELSKVTFILAVVEDNLKHISPLKDLKPRLNSNVIINSLLTDAGSMCLLVLNDSSEPIHLGIEQSDPKSDFVQFARQALQSGKRAIHFIGTTWGVFWKQNRYMIVSAPLIRDGKIFAGLSIGISLEDVYKTLRGSQKIFLIYILINCVLLTFIGIYRLSKLYFEPLSRLAKRAEDYKEDDEIIFAVRKEDNELNRLSKALNSMLRRISLDREKLRSTVASLEKTNRELQKAQKEVIRAEKLASVGRLSAGIAHEIGNPIGIVMGYLDLLKQHDISSSEKDEYIRRTEEEVERINKIIRQLLEISRPSNSGQSPVSVHELIDNLTDVFDIQPLTSNMVLESDLAAEKDIVLSDPNQLRQVFLNLIINAADAISSTGHAANGKLKIVTEVVEKDGVDPKDPSELLKIMFIDNGPGIPEESLGNIFDPFYTTKAPGKGTGLGLSVSFMIIEGFGGKMTVHSEQGKGTTMIVYLPLHADGHLRSEPDENI